MRSVYSVLLTTLQGVAVGQRLVFQQLETGDYRTQIEMGTPPQVLTVGSDFQSVDICISKPESVLPFTPFFDPSTSSTFLGLDASNGADVFNQFGKNLLRNFFHGGEGGGAGRIGFSPKSRIAQQYALVIRGESVGEPMQSVRGFTVDLLKRAPRTEGPFQEIIAPVVGDSNLWLIRGSLSIGSSAIGGISDIEIDPSYDYIMLPREHLNGLLDVIGAMGHRVEVDTIDGYTLRALFPCNTDGTILVPPFVMTLHLDGTTASSTEIRIPNRCMSEPVDGRCVSVFQGNQIAPRIILGRSMVEGRDSIILDALSSHGGGSPVVRFIDHHPRVPLNAARPVVPGFTVPPPVLFRPAFDFRPNGIEFSSSSSATNGYQLTSIEPIRLSRMGQSAQVLLTFRFLCFSPPCMQGDFNQMISGLFHMPNELLRIDMETQRVSLGLVPATDPKRPVYALALHADRFEMLLSAYVVTDFTVDFDSLDTRRYDYMSDAAANTKEGGEEPCCCVCMDGWTSESADDWIQISSCKHSFHRECLRDWTERKLTCPMCRDDIGRKPNSLLRRQSAITTTTTTSLPATTILVHS